MSEGKSSRSGILCGGNFIVDRIRMIDRWPPQDSLATITAESSSNGGGPFNVLVDLARLGAEFPLEAAGCVGSDEAGEWILQQCQRYKIDISQIHKRDDAPTSYTEVMCVSQTGRRTFFHQRGANARFGPEHLDFEKSNATHFHLAYLLLLDGMDSPGKTGGTKAADVLSLASDAGLTTSVDLVSAESADFSKIVECALPFTDLLFINEIEAERATGVSLSGSSKLSEGQAVKAVTRLLEAGVRKQVVLHHPMGAVLGDQERGITFSGSLDLPEDWIVGSAGAGDAFAAGYLKATLEDASNTDRLKLAFCAAAASLREPGPSDGVLTACECLDLEQKFSYRV